MRDSDTRKKFRSGVLNELAKERANKKFKTDERKVLPTTINHSADQDNEDELLATRSDIERKMDRNRNSSNSLVAILPRPKNASSFGPTIKFDKLFKKHEKDSNEDESMIRPVSPSTRLTDDGLLEVDVGKEIGDSETSAVKELTIEGTRPAAISVPKGKEKQKNQITYLARLGKATEIEHQEKAAQSRANKAAARSKYGW